VGIPLADAQFRKSFRRLFRVNGFQKTERVINWALPQTVFPHAQ
jgi:hypothetical protein